MPLLTVGQALQYCSKALDEAGVFFGHGTDNAWDEAVQLVLHVANLPVDAGRGVMSDPLDAAARREIDQLLRRRIEDRVPLPYLTGRAWFAGLELRSDRRAIVPRSPIGELILSGFSPWYNGPNPTRVLDLCCGGGGIGLAIAHYFPECTVDLVDIDEAALDLCRENRDLLGLSEQVRILESDLFSTLGGECYDIILSNPPYVNARDLADMPPEYLQEPELALGSGQDGLNLTRRLLAEAGPHLKEHGLLVVEVGNSWPALEEAYPLVPFTWLEFEHGGDGVFALTAAEWKKYAQSWAQ